MWTPPCCAAVRPVAGREGRGGRRRVHLRHRRGGAHQDESGRVTGVRAGDDEITAEVVILAEAPTPCLRALPGQRPPQGQPDGRGHLARSSSFRQRHRGPLPAPRGRGRGDALRGRLHQGAASAAASCTPTRSPSPWALWPPSPGRGRIAQRGPGLPDARGLQNTRPWRRSSAAPRWSALRPHGARGRLQHDPEVRLRRLPDRRRDRGPVHEHGLPGARHGFSPWRRAAWPAEAAVAAIDAGDTSAAGLASYRAPWRARS